jgi:death-on-curing protein
VTWNFLSVDAVIVLHTALIEESGGSHGLRDSGLLESAISRAENKVNYDPEATVATVAASLSWGLIKNHAFIDGNKRIGLAALVVFLEANSYQLACTVEEEIAMVLRAAASEITEEDGRRGWCGAWRRSEVVNGRLNPTIASRARGTRRSGLWKACLKWRGWTSWRHGWRDCGPTASGSGGR